MSRRYRAEWGSLPPSPLLIGRSRNEFVALRKALEREIGPHGIVEQLYVSDVVHLVWDILRLRRSKAGIINVAFRRVLATLLTQLLQRPEQLPSDVQDKAAALANAWFTDEKAKKQVAQILRQFQLDESAIEAEAIRDLSADLERFDRLLASLESRRNKALRGIAEYRGGLARHLQERTDEIIAGEVFVLEDASSKKPSRAA